MASGLRQVGLGGAWLLLHMYSQQLLRSSTIVPNSRVRTPSSTPLQNLIIAWHRLNGVRYSSVSAVHLSLVHFGPKMGTFASNSATFPTLVTSTSRKCRPSASLRSSSLSPWFPKKPFLL